MRYTVEARFVRELASPQRLRKRPVLYALWQTLFCAPMVPLSYSGLFAATALFELMPSQLVAVHADNPDMYFPVAALSLVVIAAFCLWLGFNLYRRLRVLRSIDIDVIVPLLGSIVSFCFVLATLLEGGVP
jgi:hypothetical protein